MNISKIRALIVKHKLFITILSIGVIVRLFFISFPPFKTDMDSFIAWGEYLKEFGFGNFYNGKIWTDYAPGYLYFLWLIANIKASILPHASREAYEFLHKLVPIIFDLGIGVVIYIFLKNISLGPIKTRDKLACTIAGIYIFSPFTYFNSALWGQADSVFTFFLAVSVLSLLYKRYSLAAALYVVAGVIKPQAIIIAPAYLLFFCTNFSSKIFLRSLLSGFAVFFLLCSPFFGIASIQRLYAVLQSSVDTYPYGSLNTFNYWGTLGFWQKDTQLYAFNMTQQQFGSLIFTVIALIGFFFFGWVSKRQKQENSIYIFSLYAAFLIICGVTFLTRMHERYIFPFFFYMLLSMGILLLHLLARAKPTLRLVLGPHAIFVTLLYAIFSFTHLVNLYYVYVYYQYFNIGVPADNSLFYAVESSLKSWSMAQLGFVIIYLLSTFYYGIYIRKLQHV